MSPKDCLRWAVLAAFCGSDSGFNWALLTTCPNPSWALRLARFGGHLQHMGHSMGRVGSMSMGEVAGLKRQASVLQINFMQYPSVAPCGEISRPILEAFGTI